jgi:hypothetical protein
MIMKRKRFRFSNRKRRNEGGAAVVEAAIITPLFFSLILGICEFGPMFFQYGSVKNSVSEGVRLASIVGSSATADYDTVRAMRNSLKNVGQQLDYIIVYKAANIKAGPPAECKTAADAGLTGTDANTAVGLFDAGNAPGGAPHYGAAWTVETFDFGAPRAIGDPPIIACNIYYRRMFETPKALWTYDRAAAVPTPPTAPLFSLDRYYPGSVRVDYQSGPQDFVGVFVQSQYNSPTGLFGARKIRNFGVVRIEPVRANK